MKLLLMFFTAILLTATKADHQDTPLELKEDGTILGLPERFEPAKIDLSEKYLRINNHEVFFPPCLNQYLSHKTTTNLRLSGSWYHSKEIMPYYLNVQLTHGDEKHFYSILFDLETLNLIEAREYFNDGNSYYYPEIKLDSLCLANYHGLIKTN